MLELERKQHQGDIKPITLMEIIEPLVQDPNRKRMKLQIMTKKGTKIHFSIIHKCRIKQWREALTNILQ